MANHSALTLEQLQTARRQAFDTVWKTALAQIQMNSAQPRIRELGNLHEAIDALYWIALETEGRIKK
tara:strand:+ start:36 stop:236 length:201 start_codon:yes stop_codon:yes gene_type:complete